MPDRNVDLERFIYRQLDPLRPAISYWADRFNLDPILVASILVVERQQYHLPDVLRALRRAGHGLLDLVRMVGAVIGGDTTKQPWTDVMAWVNCSRGFCRIKFDTANEAWRRHRYHHPRPLLSEMDICNHETDPFLSVAVSCMILDELARQWTPTVRCIRDLPEIMATLYNISDFHNKPPHPFPRVGGSELGVVVDGRYIESERFGARVLAVMQSETMKDWSAKLCRR